MRKASTRPGPPRRTNASRESRTSLARTAHHRSRRRDPDHQRPARSACGTSCSDPDFQARNRHKPGSTIPHQRRPECRSPWKRVAFARLGSVAPIPISCGKTRRMRWHRGGDRQANLALHVIAVCRLRYDPKTITYMERRRVEGLFKKDVLRCLNTSSPERSSATSRLSKSALAS